MKVTEIMSRQPAPIDPSTTIAEAARTMRDGDLGCLLIGQRRAGLRDRHRPRHRGARSCQWHEPDPRAGVRRDVERGPILLRGSARRERGEDHGGAWRPPAARARPAGAADRRRVAERRTGGELRKKKPYAVTFYKHLTDGRGTLHEVPIRTVYVAAVDGEDEAVTVATAIFKRHWGPARWEGAADGCRIDSGR